MLKVGMLSNQANYQHQKQRQNQPSFKASVNEGEFHEMFGFLSRLKLSELDKLCGDKIHPEDKWMPTFKALADEHLPKDEVVTTAVVSLDQGLGGIYSKKDGVVKSAFHFFFGKLPSAEDSVRVLVDRHDK